MSGGSVLASTRDGVSIVTLNRPHVRNAVDDATAVELERAFADFDEDDGTAVAILTGADGCFCAGADLKAVADGRRSNINPTGTAPMGPTRMSLSKPVIAAIEGYAVAGGLELAIWCDLRVAARDATLGVFSRRFGVPLIDGGTFRLPRLIGQGRALDLILTGRAVDANEALSMGLVDRIVEPGEALEAALALARRIAAFPQISLRADRLSTLEAWERPQAQALAVEFDRGFAALAAGEAVGGAQAFASGEGRSGEGT